MAHKPDVDSLLEQLLSGRKPGEIFAVLSSLMADRASDLLSVLRQDEPEVADAPAQVVGFRVRLDLHNAKPPVWRRLEIAGDITLLELHDVLQTAMGWSGTHLHHFRVDDGPNAAYFITDFDRDEGDQGVLEDDVRLDQVVATVGDRLWYDYDFGDGWEHVLTVEAVLDAPPAVARCTGGRKACPPENSGGIEGYAELAAWVRSGYDDSLLPPAFDTAEHARDWLPNGWHPDHFNASEADAALAGALDV